LKESDEKITDEKEAKEAKMPSNSVIQ